MLGVIDATLTLLLTYAGFAAFSGSAKSIDTVEYFIGDQASKIILISGHGGTYDPGDISERTHGCSPSNIKKDCVFKKNSTCASREYCRVVTKADAYTIELMKTTAEVIGNITGLRPHYVVNNLARKYLDVNRNVSEAAQGDEAATEVYNKFHGSIEDAKERVHRGILVDIHGYSTHPHGLIELGYLVKPEDLNSGNIDLTESSLKSLSKNCVCLCQDNSENNLLTHPVKSLGSMLEAEGYLSMPAPKIPSPDGRKYYRGGYITRYHGSRYKGNVDSIQVEIPAELRWNPDKREQFAAALGRSIAKFHKVNYNGC